MRVCVRARCSFGDMDSVVISRFAGAAGRRQPPEAIHICGANFTGGGLVGGVRGVLENGLAFARGHKIDDVLCGNQVCVCSLRVGI